MEIMDSIKAFDVGDECFHVFQTERGVTHMIKVRITAVKHSEKGFSYITSENEYHELKGSELRTHEVVIEMIDGLLKRTRILNSDIGNPPQQDCTVSIGSPAETEQHVHRSAPSLERKKPAKKASQDIQSDV